MYGHPMLKPKLLQPLTPAPSRLRIIAMRAKGSGKYTVVTLITTIAGVFTLPELAQFIGATGALIIALLDVAAGRR